MRRARGRPRGEVAQPPRANALGTMPFGRLGISGLSIAQIAELDRLALKWGCETLAEAALEILRDALEVEDVQE